MSFISAPRCFPERAEPSRETYCVHGEITRRILPALVSTTVAWLDVFRPSKPLSSIAIVVVGKRGTARSNKSPRAALLAGHRKENLKAGEN